MSVTIPHILHIYQKPRLGTGYITSFPTTNYKHKLSSFGGCDTASCQIVCSQAQAERIFAECIGNAVRVHVDDPITPIFDGFINRVTLEVGNIVVTRSLDNMMNRIRVTYYNADSAAAQKTELTAAVNNATSQATYMVKEGSIDAGVHYNNGDKSHKNIMRGTFLSIYSNPQVSTVSRAGGGVLLTIELKGWYHIWDWQIYQNTGATLYAASNLVLRTLIRTDANAPGNAVYIYDTDNAIGQPGVARITSNAAFNQAETSQQGQTYLQFAQSIVEAGGNSQKWVLGISKPDANTGQRLVYYQPANTSAIYTARALSNTGKIFDVYGRTVDPWRVEADAGIRVTDILTGYVLNGDDPTLAYLDTIEYDAETGIVSWQSGDDITLEGAMQLNKYFKRHGSRFGAPVRQLV